MPIQFKSEADRQKFLQRISRRKRPNSKGGYFRQLKEQGRSEELKQVSTKGAASVNRGEDGRFAKR